MYFRRRNKASLFKDNKSTSLMLYNYVKNHIKLFLSLCENIDRLSHFSLAANWVLCPENICLPWRNQLICPSWLHSLTHSILRSVVWSGQHLGTQLPNPIKFFYKSLFFGLHATVRARWDLSSNLLLSDTFTLYYIMSYASML